jgi:hypothetical protein
MDFPGVDHKMACPDSRPWPRPIPLFAAILCIAAGASRASGIRDRDSAYAAAGADCRKALVLFPNDTAVEVAPSRFVCGGGFSFDSQQDIDKAEPRSLGPELETALRERSKARHSLIAFGYDRAGKIEIRGDSVTVWRRFSPRFGVREEDPRPGRLSPSEVKALDSLVAVAPGGIFGNRYLIDIEADAMWISAYGKKLIEIDPGVHIWGDPLKDIGNLCRFLQTVSDRIAGKAAAPNGISQEELDRMDIK